MATKKNILAVLHWLEVHSKQVLQESLIPLYFLILGDLPNDVLPQAAILHTSRSHYFPHPSELRKAALEILQASNPAPDAFEAWGEVNAEIERTGYLGKPSFSHELIERAVAALGWRHLCLSPDRMSDRSNFLQAYRAQQGKHSRELAWPEAVRQYIDSGESLVAIPAVIGDDEDCQTALEG